MSRRDVDALFYVDALPEVGQRVVVDGDEGFHAATVRRIRVGEELDLGDGAGDRSHTASSRSVAKGRLGAAVHVGPSRRPTPSVTVVQALPKSDRSELAIELATEAGADAFVAWQSHRCVARWDGAKARQGPATLAGGGPVGGQAVARARISRRSRSVMSTAELSAHVARPSATGPRGAGLHESATAARRPDDCASGQAPER